jgi:predicted Zn finger-like uncharacterized protein
MPITISCPSCNKEYRVDDKLAGKKVKCRECGTPISVGAAESSSAGTRPPESARSAEEAPASQQSGAVRRCPSCRTPMAASATYCNACGWSPAPAPTDAPVDAGYGVGGDAPVKRKRKWVRDPGNRKLNSLDSLLNLLLWCGLIAGLGVWVFHIAKSPWGLGAVYLLPVGATLAAIVISAALMNVGIRLAARFLEFPPRDDSLNRCLLVLFLPFAVSLLAGWPGLDSGLFSTIITLAWIATPALFVYFFRAEPLEWAASIGAGLTGFFVGYIIISQLAGPIGSVATLYRKMLPDGPWTVLATADLALPEEPKPAKPTAIAATQSATSSTEPAPMFSVAGKGPSATQPSETNQPENTQSAGTPAAPPPPEEFSFLTDVIKDKPEFQNVADIRSGFGDYVVIAKNPEDGIATIERWTIDPLGRKGSTTVIESAVRPATFVLANKGDLLLACTHLPLEQAKVLSFDSSKPQQALSVQNFPGATPVALGFLESAGGRVVIRTGSSIRFFTISAINNALNQASNLTLPPEAVNEPDGIAMSPDGRHFAILDNEPAGLQIVIYDPLSTVAGLIARRIQVTSAPVEKVIGLAYSPDGKQIAACAVMQQLTTLLPFNTGNGTALPSLILSAGEPAFKTEGEKTPGLLWLQNNLAWLLNGNDLYDTRTGKKIGSFHVSDVINEQLAGPDSIMLLQRPPGGGCRAVLARIDDDKIRAAAQKLQQ